MHQVLYLAACECLTFDQDSQHQNLAPRCGSDELLCVGSDVLDAFVAGNFELLFDGCLHLDEFVARACLLFEELSDFVLLEGG